MLKRIKKYCMSVVGFYSFLIGSFGATLLPEAIRRFKGGEFYNFRQLPPTIIHPVRNELDSLRKQIRENNGVWEPAHIKRLNELRARLREEEPFILNEAVSGLKMVHPDKKLQYNEWLEYIGDAIKELVLNDDAEEKEKLLTQIRSLRRELYRLESQYYGTKNLKMA